MLLGGDRSVRHKLLIVVMATTSAALLTAAVAMLVYDLRTYQQSWVDDLTTQGDILGKASAPALAFDDPKTARESMELLKARPQILAAAIYTARGAIFASYNQRQRENYQFPALPEADGYRIEGKELVVFKRIVDNKEILGTVYLRARYELFERLKNYVGILSVVLTISLLLAVLISLRMSSVIIKPILAISDVTRKVIESRDFTLRVKKTTEDEIGYLAEGFNAMLAEIGSRSEDQRRAEEDLRQLNAQLEQRVAARTAELEASNKELESFSYSVSHDLRAPVRAVAGYSRMMCEDHGDQLDDEAKRKIGVIESEAVRMGILIDDLLAFSKLGRQAIQPSAINMDELAKATYERLVAQTNDLKSELRIGALPEANADRSLIAQVWVNLLSNALKFSGKRDKPCIEVGAISTETEHTYYVRDNGAGFDSRYKAKLFGVFQRLHAAADFAGTGVGLALVSRVINRHGGRVWAEGELDKGASFYFTLPKVQTDAGL
jgi:signal transduction histidine kinase